MNTLELMAKAVIKLRYERNNYGDASEHLADEVLRSKGATNTLQEMRAALAAIPITEETTKGAAKAAKLMYGRCFTDALTERELWQEVASAAISAFLTEIQKEK